MKQLSCENLSIGYEGSTVLENINFSIDKGDYLCVIGENGAGKTTLIKTILNIISPKKGKVNFHEGLSHKSVGYVAQTQRLQKDFPASSFEVVISGALNTTGLRPFYTKKEKEKAMNNLKKLNIEHLAKKRFANLSGGQQKRVLLARALCTDGEILLLDEPASALDASSSEEMYRIIKTLNDEGITIIMISHDIDTALKFANKILLIKDRLEFFTTQEYKLMQNQGGENE